MNNAPKYQTRITRLTVLPDGEPVFSEQATHVEIDDEAAGEFVKITQISEDLKEGTVVIDPAEWPHIKGAVDQLMAYIESYERIKTK